MGFWVLQKVRRFRVFAAPRWTNEPSTAVRFGTKGSITINGHKVTRAECVWCRDAILCESSFSNRYWSAKPNPFHRFENISWWHNALYGREVLRVVEEQR